MDEWIGCDTRTQDGKSCPARALVIAHFNFSERDVILGYCSHHFGHYKERLAEAADWIEDHRQAAFTKETTS